MTVRVDLFCRVIDNFGDIGVCWRLARRLNDEYGCSVRLWVDELASFKRLAPEVRIDLAGQNVQGIAICRWVDEDAWHDVVPGDLVIEAFACDPPPGFVQAMRRAAVPPVWVNLEYLATEPWADGCHGLPSKRADGLHKSFFFPGFSAHTGGLLREPDLLARRGRLGANPQAAHSDWRVGILESIGLHALALRLAPRQTADACAPRPRLVVMFAYPTLPVAALLGACADSWPHTIVAVPEGTCPGAEDVAATLPNIEIERIAFVRQEAFDPLLWCADLNIVRGEDSFVRAIWTGQPLLWHIYPQAQDAHMDKLNAWLERFDGPQAVAEVMRQMNTAASPTDARHAKVRQSLSESLAEPSFAAWQNHCRGYADTLAGQRDLAGRMMAHYANVSKTARMPG